MAENDTQKMLKAVLFMQVEILGRLEALENTPETTGDAALDHMRKISGLTPEPTYEDPRLEALHQIREAIESRDNKGLEVAIDEIVGLINHPR
ncbi:hypothetical protein [Vreelandella lutescens]|uniref:Uncharacterized protein n=1 Tax=Vreelandella lutescens TaxID=1602943 RepID=A0ABQ1NS34_9GAMM|nr:hypothetical protein [Halomonas lutescens]GGC83893.1 hypothetical protein GCM10011382_12560 [Halomonas lutescens]